MSALLIAANRLSAAAPAAVEAPSDLGLERLRIASPSGASLAAWLLPGDAEAPIVLLMHGVRANRAAMLGRMRFLHGAGYAVLAFDFQAHGESTGSRITFGKLEALDAAAAIRWAKQRFPGRKIGVIGTSLCGAAMLLGPEPLPIDALILEAVYPDIESATRNRLVAYLGRLGEWGVRPLLAAMKWTLGGDPEDLRPIDRIAAAGCPILILGGTADTRTRIAETRALFARAVEPKALWEVDGAGHVDLASFAGDAYRDRVLDFLRRYLRQAT